MPEPSESPAPPPEDAPTAEPGAGELGQTYAAILGDKVWEVDAEPEAGFGEEEESPPAATRGLEGQTSAPNPEPRTPTPTPDPEPEVPPSAGQIIEAMLFVGGAPLRAERACEVIRGLTPEQFRETIDALNRTYRRQNRPYTIQSGESGFTLAIRPRYRGVREKLFGGPREARLTQPALDVLALVAYRQPITKAEVDSLRGAESGGVLRQLVRLGLAAVVQRGDAKQRDVSYGTTARFLELFGLRSLDDLPQTGDVQRL